MAQYLENANTAANELEKVVLDNNRGPALGKITKIKAGIAQLPESKRQSEVYKRVSSAANELEKVVLDNNRGPALGKITKIKAGIAMLASDAEESATLLPADPIRLQAKGEMDRNFTDAKDNLDTVTNASARKKKMEEARANVAEAAERAVISLNNLMNFTSPDRIAETWKSGLKDINDSIGNALDKEVTASRNGFSKEERAALENYFLSYVSALVYDEKFTTPGPIIGYLNKDSSGHVADGRGFHFSSEVSGDELLQGFKNVYGADWLMKGMVYGLPADTSRMTPEVVELLGKGKDASRTDVEDALRRQVGSYAGPVALAYLYGQKGEALDKFADSMKIAGYDAGESVTDKYVKVCMWAYEKQDVLRASYSRALPVSEGMLIGSMPVGQTNVTRGVFDFMSVAAASRQYEQLGGQTERDTLATMVNEAAKMQPYSQTMLLSGDFRTIMNATVTLSEENRQGVFRQLVDSYNSIYERSAAPMRYGHLSQFLEGISSMDRKNLLDSLRAELVDVNADGVIRVKGVQGGLLYKAARVRDEFTTQQIHDAYLAVDPYGTSDYNRDAMDRFRIVYPGNYNGLVTYNAEGMVKPATEMAWRMGIIEKANTALAAIGMENANIASRVNFALDSQLAARRFRNTQLYSRTTAQVDDSRGNVVRGTYEEGQAGADAITRDNYMQETSRNNRRHGELFASRVAATETALWTSFVNAAGTITDTGTKGYTPVAAGRRLRRLDGGVEGEAFPYERIMNSTDREVKDADVLAELNRASEAGSNLAIKVRRTLREERGSAVENIGTDDEKKTDLQGAPDKGSLDADVFYFNGGKWFRSNFRYKLNQNEVGKFVHLYDEFYQGFGNAGVLAGHETGRLGRNDIVGMDGFLAGFSVGDLGAFGARTKGGNATVGVAVDHTSSATYIAWYDATRSEMVDQNPPQPDRNQLNAGQKGMIVDRYGEGYRATVAGGPGNFAAQLLTKPVGFSHSFSHSYSFNPVTGTYVNEYVNETDVGLNTGRIDGTAYLQGYTDKTITKPEQGGVQVSVDLGNGYKAIVTGVDRGRSGGDLGLNPNARRSLSETAAEIDEKINTPGYYDNANAGVREDDLENWSRDISDILSRYTKMSAKDYIGGSNEVIGGITLVKNKVGSEGEEGENEFSIGIRYTANKPSGSVGEARNVNLVANFNVTNRLSLFGSAPLNETFPQKERTGMQKEALVNLVGVKYGIGHWTVLGSVTNAKMKRTDTPVELDVTYHGVNQDGNTYRFGIAATSFNEKDRKLSVVYWVGNPENSIAVTLSGISAEDLKEIGASAERRFGLHNLVAASVEYAEALRKDSTLYMNTEKLSYTHERIPGFSLLGSDNNSVTIGLKRQEVYGLTAYGRDIQINVGVGLSWGAGSRR